MKRYFCLFKKKRLTWHNEGKKRPQKEEKNVTRGDRSMMHSFLILSYHNTRAAVNLSATIVYLCLEHRHRLAHLCLCLCLCLRIA